MSFRSTLIITAVMLVACKGNSLPNGLGQENSKKIDRDSFLLKSIIEDFITNDLVKSDVITLECIRHQDTLKFILIDSYPLFDEGKIMGYTSFRNRKICIAGDSFPSDYINIQFKEIPSEVRNKNKEIMNSKKLIHNSNTEPLQQSVCFVGKKLIQCPQFPIH